MPHILDQIIAHKATEVRQAKRKRPLSQVRDSPLYGREGLSLSQALRQSMHFGIIAEFKRKSPSQSDIKLEADPEQIASGYEAAGAAALSVLTDQHFFGAQATDILQARAAVNIPIIRKDFIIDPYQLEEAKALGADAILLIAACLEKQQIHELTQAAHELGLEVLCELHALKEVELLNAQVDIVGVNNRNLKDFSVSISQSIELAKELPADQLRISESGIEDPQTIVRLRRAGFQGFLIGTYFMRQADPAAACANLIRQIQEQDELLKGAIA
ncbi:MAG: indole-3-glycerol phosphate synthase TrpC [Bacteroidota bacterium]